MEYMTALEVCGLFRVSRNTLIRMVNRGEIPGAIKFGRDWRIPRATVDAIIKGESNEDQADGAGNGTDEVSRQRGSAGDPGTKLDG